MTAPKAAGPGFPLAPPSVYAIIFIELKIILDYINIISKKLKFYLSIDNFRILLYIIISTGGAYWWEKMSLKTCVI